MSQVFGLWIINKYGSLVFCKSYSEGLGELKENDPLILASTFHGIDQIAKQISPVAGSSGILTVDSDVFKLSCLHTPTGVKFVLLTSPSHSGIETILNRVYETYANYLKDPFYTLDMPIRSDRFEKAIQTACARS